METAKTGATFKTTMDNIVLGITLAYFVLTVVVALTMKSPWVALFLVVIGVLSYLLNPRHYEVSAHELQIHLPVGAVKISLSSILRVQRLVRLPYIRVFGIGGLFGYYGLYWSKGTGIVRMYGRNRHNPILLVLRDGKKVVIMPDDASLLDHLST